MNLYRNLSQPNGKQREVVEVGVNLSLSLSLLIFMISFWKNTPKPPILLLILSFSFFLHRNYLSINVSHVGIASLFLCFRYHFLMLTSLFTSNFQLFRSINKFMTCMHSVNFLLINSFFLSYKYTLNFNLSSTHHNHVKSMNRSLVNQ